MTAARSATARELSATPATSGGLSHRPPDVRAHPQRQNRASHGDGGHYPYPGSASPCLRRWSTSGRTRHGWRRERPSSDRGPVVRAALCAPRAAAVFASSARFGHRRLTGQPAAPTRLDFPPRLAAVGRPRTASWSWPRTTFRGNLCSSTTAEGHLMSFHLADLPVHVGKKCAVARFSVTSAALAARSTCNSACGGTVPASTLTSRSRPDGCRRWSPDASASLRRFGAGPRARRRCNTFPPSRWKRLPAFRRRQPGSVRPPPTSPRCSACWASHRRRRGCASCWPRRARSWRRTCRRG